MFQHFQATKIRKKLDTFDLDSKAAIPEFRTLIAELEVGITEW